MKSEYELLHPDCHIQEYLETTRVTMENLDVSPVPPSSTFTVGELSLLEGHEWMKLCKFYLVVPPGGAGEANQYGVETLELTVHELLSRLEGECKTVDRSIVPHLPKELGQVKVIALDWETTGLDVTSYLHGGQWVYSTVPVGLALATSPYTGYYLPIGNTGQDSVKNWDLETIRCIVNHLMQPDFHVLYFNAKFDCSITQSIKVPVNPIMTDLYGIHRLMGNYEFFEGRFMRINNLKDISEYSLGRKMITIPQLLGFKSKKADGEALLFNRLPAVNSAVYGASDGINTYALFNEWVLKDVTGRNPYKHQPTASTLEMLAILPVMSMLSVGIPIDYNYAKGILSTVYRRLLLVEKKLHELWGYEINVNSSEQVGKYVASQLMTGWTGDENSFLTILMNSIGMESTVREFKHVGRKVTYNLGDPVIKALMARLNIAIEEEEEEEDDDDDDVALEEDRSRKPLVSTGEDVEFFWVPSEVKVKLAEGVRLLSMFRSLYKEKNNYLGILRSIKRDDRGFPYINFGTKQSGTDTGRFSHDKSKGVDRVSIEIGKKGLHAKHTAGDGTTLVINSQGFSGRKLKMVKARKLTKMPQEIRNILEQRSAVVKKMYVEDLVKL